jgi:hypothetical protein
MHTYQKDKKQNNGKYRGMEKEIKKNKNMKQFE